MREPMRSYTLHIHDDRSTTPNLVLVECVGDARVGEIALRRLRESRHNRFVEVRHGDEIVFIAHAEDPDISAGAAHG